jgi:hypothetical protein
MGDFSNFTQATATSASPTVSPPNSHLLLTAQAAPQEFQTRLLPPPSPEQLQQSQGYLRQSAPAQAHLHHVEVPREIAVTVSDHVQHAPWSIVVDRPVYRDVYVERPVPQIIKVPRGDPRLGVASGQQEASTDPRVSKPKKMDMPPGDGLMTSPEAIMEKMNAKAKGTPQGKRGFFYHDPVFGAGFRDHDTLTDPLDARLLDLEPDVLPPLQIYSLRMEKKEAENARRKRLERLMYDEVQPPLPFRPKPPTHHPATVCIEDENVEAGSLLWWLT